MSDTRNIGKTGEDVACYFLQKKKYKLITTNFRSRFGEIDLIMLDGKQLVFVEVKTRSENISGTPAEAISSGKLSKMVKTVQYFLTKYPKYTDYRFDAVEVLMVPQISINHIKNITF